MAEFFDRLAEGAIEPFGRTGQPDTLPEDWHEFRLLCEAREREGRKRYGDAWCERDNVREAFEELADHPVYMLFAVRQARLEGRDDNLGVALEAARHVYLAFYYTRLWRAMERSQSRSLFE